MTEQRLQKILARGGVASRRKAEELISAGRVTIDGRVAGVGDKADPETQSVKVDGRRVRLPREHRYLLLNKPKGYLTTHSDQAGRPTVYHLLPAGMADRLVAVGRLDFQSEGLLLLTDDGDFAHRVAHPSFGCTKTYEVKVRGLPAEETLDKLRRGVVLDGRRTAPAVIAALRARPGSGGARGSSWWRVTLGEGRTRQIREMFFRAGHSVQKLRRVAIGRLADPRLRPGAYRELTEAERRLLLATGKPASGARPRTRRRSRS